MYNVVRDVYIANNNGLKWSIDDINSVKVGGASSDITASNLIGRRNSDDIDWEIYQDPIPKKLNELEERIKKLEVLFDMYMKP
jgi:hypothetical protein